MSSKHRSPQAGFHLVIVVVIFAVVCAVSFVVFRMIQERNKSTDNTSNNSADQQSSDASEDNQPVRWAFNEQKHEYFVQSGKAPACKEPFTFDHTPADLSKANVVGMPGSYRGFSYKPHGAIRFDGTPSGNIEVKMPMDATLVSLTRYYEGNPSTLQYLMTFESDCGIAFRFDHLHTLTAEFQRIAEQTPEPKKDDTRTDPNRPFPRTRFKAGDVVATTIGFPNISNIGFDFGVYDYRKRNDISKNAEWAKIHNNYTAQEWFAACWIPMLPGTDAAKAKELSMVVLNPSKPNIISDLCPWAPHKTLDFNNGQPTDG